MPENLVFSNNDEDVKVSSGAVVLVYEPETSSMDLYVPRKFEEGDGIDFVSQSFIALIWVLGNRREFPDEYKKWKEIVNACPLMENVEDEREDY